MNEFDRKILGIIESIKGLIRYSSGKPVSHYTSLDALFSMLFSENDHLRLSEGVFMNDLTEGEGLFDFLDLKVYREDDVYFKTVHKERPFIGSFIKGEVENLTAWRLYGRNGGNVEASGCAIDLNLKFLHEFKLYAKSQNVDCKDEDFNLYRVIYYKVHENLIDGDWKRTFEFSISGLSEDHPNNELLNSQILILKNELSTFFLKPIDKSMGFVLTLIDYFSYFFKSIQYSTENEIRLIIKGETFKKFFSPENNPKNVYIKTGKISPYITSITLGPKVEFPKDVRAVIHYKLLDMGIENEKLPEIKISELKFR